MRREARLIGNEWFKGAWSDGKQVCPEPAARASRSSPRAKDIGVGDHFAVDIEPIRREWSESVIELWEQAGLIRPWNDPRADLRRAVEGPASDVLVGHDDGRLVAAVMVGHDGHRGWVYYLAVHPQLHRHGYGRAVMQAAQDWLRAQGIPKLNVMVREDNDQAGGFYQSLGYRADAVRVFSLRLDGNNR